MLILRDELERTNKEPVVAYFNILSQQLSAVALVMERKKPLYAFRGSSRRTPEYKAEVFITNHNIRSESVLCHFEFIISTFIC